MVEYNPNERITIAEILKHDWYSDTQSSENEFDKGFQNDSYNSICDDDQLYDIMNQKFEQVKENKSKALAMKKNQMKEEEKKEKENECDDSVMGNDQVDIIDQEKTLAEFEATLSQFGSVIENNTGSNTNRSRDHAQGQGNGLSLITINENKEIEKDEQSNGSKRLSLLGTVKKRLSLSGSGGMTPGGSVLTKTESMLSSYISSKVTSEIESWQSLKCYTICDPLVLMVGIGEYHDNLQNLIGMTKDYKNMIYTFNNKYHYSMFYQTNKNKMIYTGEKIVNLDNEHISQINKIEWSCDEILEYFIAARDIIVSNKHDSLIAIISCHGDSEGVILDSEFEDLQLHEIFYQFMRDNCPYLQDKPKIVFVDACRGGLKSYVKKPLSTKNTFNFKGKNNSNNGNNINTTSDSNGISDNKQTIVEILNLEMLEINNYTSNNSDNNSIGNIYDTKLKDTLLPYHNEGNYYVVYANIDGYAVLEGGKRGGYLLQSVRKVFCNEKRILNKDTTLSDIILQVNAKAQRLAGNGVIVQQIQQVNQMDGRIKFEKRNL